MVLLAAEICEDKKGTDTRILELDPADAGFTDFFLITSGNNTRQTGAIADEIELRMKREFGTYAKSVEGRRSGEWILLDYVDFVVHIFTEETREYYDIERLRKSARSLGTAELSAALREKTEAARKKGSTRKALPADTSDGNTKPAETKPMPPAKKAAKKAPAKALAKAPAKKAPAKKAPAKKAAAKKNAPAKAVAKKAAGKKAPAKAATKKAPAKKTAAKSPVKSAAKKVAANATDTSRKALGTGTKSTRRQLPSSTS